ncbi:MAG: 16S rRNA (uracil(1498)-N(3))-methyltransferase [Candidatus Scatovivens sp.]
MKKFFVKKEQINNNIIEINGEDINHIKNVLRLEENTLIQISDGNQNYISKISKIEKDKVICEIIEKSENENESSVQIDIFQGLPKSDKMEYIIQKCTELGVKNFIPVQCKRSVVKLSGKDEEKKILRWQKIAEGASKQSGRDIVPKVSSIININNVCNNIKEYDIVLVAYELEKNNSLKKELEKIKLNKEIKIGILIGPEGGLEEEEINLLKKNNARIITLGNRILRTETVALVISSIIMYEFNELGGN